MTMGSERQANGEEREAWNGGQEPLLLTQPRTLAAPPHPRKRSLFQVIAVLFTRTLKSILRYSAMQIFLL